MYKNRSIQNNPCDKAVCGQLPSMAFGLGGRAGPANPAYRRKKKKNPEVDNWTNWPPGQITGSNEDSIVKRPASNPLQPNKKLKLSAAWHPLHCRDDSEGWSSPVALCGSFLHAPVYLRKLNLYRKARCTKLQSSLQSHLFPGYGNKDFLSVLSHNLWWSKVNQSKCQFCFLAKARCNRIYAVICFSSQITELYLRSVARL